MCSSFSALDLMKKCKFAMTLMKISIKILVLLNKYRIYSVVKSLQTVKLPFSLHQNQKKLMHFS